MAKAPKVPAKWALVMTEAPVDPMVIKVVLANMGQKTDRTAPETVPVTVDPKMAPTTVAPRGGLVIAARATKMAQTMVPVAPEAALATVAPKMARVIVARMLTKARATSAAPKMARPLHLLVDLVTDARPLPPRPLLMVPKMARPPHLLVDLVKADLKSAPTKIPMRPCEALIVARRNSNATASCRATSSTSPDRRVLSTPALP